MTDVTSNVPDAVFFALFGFLNGVAAYVFHRLRHGGVEEADELTGSGSEAKAVGN